MKYRTSALLSAVAMAAFLLIVRIAAADDMGSMDMSGMTHSATAEGENPASMDRMMSSEHMENDPTMALHMGYTTLRPHSEADQHRADEMVDTLQTALAKYKDYRVAEADGFKPFHPEMKTPIIHFTKMWYAVKAQFTFNPSQPTSLLYKRTPGGGYELVGAMYTAPKRWSDDQLNQRVPLSIARWHKHINLCLPKKGTNPSTVDWKNSGWVVSRRKRHAMRLAVSSIRKSSDGWCMSIRGRRIRNWSGRTDSPLCDPEKGTRLILCVSVRSI
jgi:hypothetical protein